MSAFDWSAYQVWIPHFTYFFHRMITRVPEQYLLYYVCIQHSLCSIDVALTSSNASIPFGIMYCNRCFKMLCGTLALTIPWLLIVASNIHLFYITYICYSKLKTWLHFIFYGRNFEIVFMYNGFIWIRSLVSCLCLNYTVKWFPI